MSREALTIILGRASIDCGFLQRLKTTGGIDACAREMHVKLTKEARHVLEDMDFKGLEDICKQIGKNHPQIDPNFSP